MKWMPITGTISYDCLKPEVVQRIAGAWRGEQLRRRPSLMDLAERSPCIAVFEQEHPLGCWAIWGTSLSRGAPLLLAQPFEAW